MKPFSLSFFQKTLSHGGRKSLHPQVTPSSVLGRTRASGWCEFDFLTAEVSLHGGQEQTVGGFA
jgi:hypothetical protein